MTVGGPVGNLSGGGNGSALVAAAAQAWATQVAPASQQSAVVAHAPPGPAHTHSDPDEHEALQQLRVPPHDAPTGRHALLPFGLLAGPV
jgi:hypothetical protein